MALVLNEEQRLLKDTAREFLRERSPVDALRKLRDQRDVTGYSTELWAQMAELGWAGVTLPEAYGGLEFGYLGLGAVFEEAGRTLTASPLFSSVVLGAAAIELGGDETQKSTWLPLIASGETTFTLAVDESHHHAPERIALEARRDGETFVLNGRKQFVIDGHSAERIVVAARTSADPGSLGGITLFLVDGNADGLSRERLWLADSRGYAHLDFKDVSVGTDAVLGEIDAAGGVLESVLDRGRVVLAAEMLGSSLEAFERTVEYLKEREQFGAKIGSFQGLKHRASHMFTELELSKSVVLDALSAVDEGRDELPQLASLAKARLNDVALLVSNEAIQMHGGIGVTDELDIGFFLKRARTTMQLLGDAGYHRDRYARLSGY